MRTYAARGRNTGQLLSLGGKVLVHPDRAVLEWLISPRTASVVPVNVQADHALDFRYHPDLSHLACWSRQEVRA